MVDSKNAIEWLKGMYYSTQQYSTDDGYSKEEYHNEVIGLAIQAIEEKLERENPQSLAITVEQAAKIIEIICDNGGCPPNKDCTNNQNCTECIVDWLTSHHKTKGV